MQADPKSLKPIRLIAIDEKTKSNPSSNSKNYLSISKLLNGSAKKSTKKNTSVLLL